MKQQIITSFDVGSSLTRCVIAKRAQVDDAVHILGVGVVSSEGMRRGCVVDIADAANAIAAAANAAEEMSGERISDAVVSVSGVGISIENVRGVIAVGKADGEVTDDDITRVIASAQSVAVPANKEIIHIIPHFYRLDDQKNIKDPIGLRGVRLEVEAVVISAPKNSVANLSSAMERADVVATDYVVESLAAAQAVLTKKQKELGVALVNLGASTTSIAVYEEGEIIHTAVIPVGADFITHDLAIGLRTSIDVAEKVKIAYGSALYGDIKRTDEINLHEIDDHEDGSVRHDHVIEIVVARLEEVFDLVRSELVEIEKDQLLPAGVVLTGGGANLVHVVDFSKDILQLPVQIGYADGLLGMMDHVDDPSLATAVGLIMWQDHYGDEHDDGGSNLIDKTQSIVRSLFGSVRDFIGRFLP